MSNIKLRLIILEFLEFFIWGAWLVSLGGYLMFGLATPATPAQVGLVFAASGISSLFMPALVGIIADKWMNSERLFAICHLLGTVTLFFAARMSTFEALFPWMLLNAFVFMPTMSLSYSMNYSLLAKAQLDPVKAFPPIRVWGTVGFIVAMWVVSILNWTVSSNQLLLASAASLLLAIYSLTLPSITPMRSERKVSLSNLFGLDAWQLFRKKQLALFFLFAVLIGICLKITNAYGTPFILSFQHNPMYAETFTVRYSGIILSISQIAEALFILAIPFTLKHFGIKKTILISLLAWTLRFGFFGIGNPGSGFVWLLLSMIIYGMAFDFFNISASLYVEKESPAHLRASAQGFLQLAVNGIGSVVGLLLAPLVIDYYTVEGTIHWQACWFAFAAYAFVVGILFALFWRGDEVSR